MKTTARKFVVAYRRHQIRVGRFLAGLGLPEYTILTIFSIVMGVAAGFAGVGLHALIDVIGDLFFGPGQRAGIGLAIILVPAAGMVLQSAMTHLAPRQAGHRGVLEVIKSVAMCNGRIPVRTTLFHFLAPAICIGTGGTVGPEAPAAQSGAGVVSGLGSMMGLAESRQRIFTAAGAGAAIAAIFNTPLAGVFFAIEVVLLHDFRVSALSAFLLASVSASAVSRILLGNEPVLVIHAIQIESYSLFPFYLLLGLVAGLISIAFIRTNESIKTGCKTIFKVIPRPVAMLSVGLLMGVAGLWQPGIFGIGYGSMNKILSGTVPEHTVAILLVLKFLLVALILGVGGFGGVFAPSLFLGGCAGHLFAVGASHLFGIALDPTTFTLVGMGAVLAGINSVPLTAIMILFEMTNDYHFMLPLMLGVVGSTLMVHMVLKGSIYARELEQEGYRYAMGKDTRILETIPVRQVMRREILTVAEGVSLAELIQQCLDHPHDTIYTRNSDGEINGVILSSSLHQLITEYQTLKTMVVAKDLADPKVPLLQEDVNLDHALRMFAKYRVEEMPVVSSAANDKILGTLHYQDVLSYYNQARIKVNLTDELSANIRTIRQHETNEVLPGLSVTDVDIPGNFVNKTLKELRLRNRFDIDVLLIEQDGGPFAAQDQEMQRVFPQTDYRFSHGDRVIIFGKKEKVEAFRSYARRH